MATFRIEAETLTINAGFVVNNLSVASGGRVLKAGTSGEQRASFAFTEVDGLYDVGVGYFDENDGVATLELRVNGITIESWAWNQDLGSANVTSSTDTIRTIRNVAIRAGDTVEIAGFSNAGEPLRTDFLDFTRTGDITGGDTAPPFAQSTAAADISTAGAATHAITVTFIDTVALASSSFDPSDVTITGPGGGTLTVVSAQVNNPADGSPRTVTYTVNAPGGSWDASDNGTYNIALNAGQVFDTSNNAASAGHLDSFAVAIGTAPTEFRIEAETLTSHVGFETRNIASASGGKVIVGGTTAEQRASFSFAGADGLYEVGIGYYDENDGVARLELRVNGFTVDSWLWDQNLGSPNAGPATRTTHTIANVAIRAGDTVEIAGFTNAGEPLRTDYLDFSRTGEIPRGGDAAPPVVQTVTVADIAAGGAATHTVTVTFADNVGLETSSFDPGDLTITGPTGALTIVSAQVSNPVDGSPRTVVYTVNAPGGSWDAADDGIYTVALKPDQVFDTSANPVAANPNLDSFIVNIGGNFRIEAEALTVDSGFVVNNLAAASGGRILKANSSGEARAHLDFTGADGLYDVKIGYYDENDGVATMALRVNGATVDSWAWDQNLGSPNPTSSTDVVHNIPGVVIREGDTVEIVGLAEGGEPVRTDFLDFNRTGDIPEPSALLTVTIQNSVNSSSFGNNSFRVTNTGGAAITAIEIDLSTVSLTSPGSRIVFDPAAVAGDSSGAPFTLDTIFADSGTAFNVTGVLYDGDPDFTDDGLARQQQGYQKMTVLVSGFDPGDQVRFHIDVDPTSIFGVPVAGHGDAGSIAGAELSGATFRAVSGGATLSSVVLARGAQSNQGAGASGEGSSDSHAVASPQGPVAVTIEGVRNGGQLTTADADPLVTLTGPANATVRLVVLEGDVAGTGVALDPADYELDTVRSVQSYLVQLNASGQGSRLIDVARDTVTSDGQAPTFIIQAAVVSTVPGYGAVATGETSQGIRLRYDSGQSSLSRVATLAEESEGLPAIRVYEPLSREVADNPLANQSPPDFRDLVEFADQPLHLGWCDPPAGSDIA